MTSNASDRLQLLVDHELAIKRLYLAFASAFEDSRDFWQTLAGDEQGHADKLETLHSEPKLDQWLGAETRILPKAVQSSMEYVQTEASRARAGDLTMLQALSVAKDIEDALIDRLLLLPDAPVCAEISAVVSELREETSRHRELIADALEIEKRIHG